MAEKKYIYATAANGMRSDTIRSPRVRSIPTVCASALRRCTEKRALTRSLLH